MLKKRFDHPCDITHELDIALGNHTLRAQPTDYWLFTKRGGVEFGAAENKSIQWKGGGFEPGTSGLQVQRPTTRPRCPPLLCKAGNK